MLIYFPGTHLLHHLVITHMTRNRLDGTLAHWSCVRPRAFSFGN